MNADTDIQIKEQAKYEAMWGIDDYRNGSPGDQQFETALPILKDHGLKELDSVIDFGCGTGRATAKFVDAGLTAIGIDIAHNAPDNPDRYQFIIGCLWDLPSGLPMVDWGYCCDVMEHIPTDKVDAVFASIAAQVDRGCYFNIACFEDAFGKRINDTLHLTVKKPEWWIEKVSVHFGSVKRITKNFGGRDKSVTLLALR